ncbi:MAG: hypothetical protein KKA64_01420 [Nanoarchaeota archaeon]|nr:hypothetical protein [Nanoarchaeota archaeon]
MIKNNEPLSMVEALGLMKKVGVENPELVSFINKFTEIKPKDAEEIKNKITNLNLLKVKSEHIAHIINLMPENEIDLNKIFVDVGLDENEAKKILDIIKEYK